MKLFSLNKEIAGHLFLLGLLTALVFGNSLFNNFVYDDKVFVVHNPQIRQLSNAGGFFVSAKAYAGARDFFIYRPLAALSYAWDYFCWGLNPAGFHLTNILLHILNVLLVYLLGSRLLRERGGALLMAALFAIHPAQAETVSWIAARSNLLCLLFFLLALLCYIKYSRRNYGLALLFFILSLLAKETAVIFVGVIWLYDYYYVLKVDKAKAVNAWWSYLPYLVATALYLVLRTAVLGRMSQRSWWGGSLYATALTMGNSFWHYLTILVLPLRLSVDYVLNVTHNFSDPRVVAGWLAAIGLFILALTVSRRHKEAAFGLFWFLLALLPVSNIIPLEALVAERFLYFPLIGFSMCAAAIVTVPWEQKWSRNLAWVLITALLMAYGFRTYQRNKDWRNDYTLWASTVKTSPESPRAHFALGDVYYQRGEYLLAIDQYQEALQLNPQVAELYNALGLAYEEVPDYSLASGAYRQGLKVPALAPETKSSLWINLGNVYCRMGAFDQARTAYQKVLDLDPANPAAEHNLAIIKARQQSRRP